MWYYFFYIYILDKHSCVYYLLEHVVNREDTIVLILNSPNDNVVLYIIFAEWIHALTSETHTPATRTQGSVLTLPSPDERGNATLLRTGTNLQYVDFAKDSLTIVKLRSRTIKENVDPIQIGMWSQRKHRL